MKNAQIHRFRDTVAIALPGKGQTVYVSRQEAAAIARALNAAGRDIKARPFADSQFKAVSVPVAGAAD